ncbi:ion transporter [Streptomyces sp. NPDC089799]|uniref:ion transporter n=1 Tax=Streptomyces sp. NPDC089799 TaxID=3155066 RepID=UPI00341E5AB6
MVPEVRSFRRRAGVAARCRAVVEDPVFGLSVFALILVNAAVLGVETYRGTALVYRQEIHAVEQVCLLLFTLELLIRAGACADRPREFFRDPWQLFDLAVVVSAFLPLLWDNTTLFRLLRLARVLRTARFLPQLRILLVAMGRSLPGTLSFLFVGGLVLYVYAMIGWICFARVDPAHYGSIGRAGLTLFLLTTMDGLTDAVRAGLAISRFSILYYASYALLASFLLVNMLIGVVLGSLDEAREMEKEERERQARPKQPGPPPASSAGVAAAVPADVDSREVRERIAGARRALDELEASLQVGAEREHLVPSGRRLEVSGSG